MREFFCIKIKIRGVIKTIYFGIPSQDDELKQMFRLRFKIYSECEYLLNNANDDLDKYDDKSIYFIAKIDDRVIGSLRLIVDYYLPTEKDCFEFKEPDAIKEIPRNMRGEISRLVVEKYSNKLFLPRHLVMIGLLKTVIDYCLKNNIDGGYGFIKNNLRRKLDFINIPIHYINDFKQIYNQETLRNYFNNPENKVWPIYYLTKEVSIFVKKFFNNKFIFKKNDSFTFIVRSLVWNIIYFIRRIIYHGA